MAFPRTRSVLFAPANRTRLLDKFAESGADVAVADLEDGVTASDAAKLEARRIFSDWITSPQRSSSAVPLFVRVNSLDTPWLETDLTLLAHAAVAGYVIPKAEHADTLQELRARVVQESGRLDLRCIAGIETATGVANSVDIACSDAVDAVYFGAEDYVTDLGGRRTDDGVEVLYARSQVVMAATIGRIPAIDQAVIDLHDDAQYQWDAGTGRTLGYRGKLCLNPRQVVLANEGFSPSAADISDARNIVAAAESAAERDDGVVAVDGRMIDAPLIARARKILAETT
jgi:citrate lyase subunit beta/citryl-CoA lyase